jgi:hypothetical protein
MTRVDFFPCSAGAAPPGTAGLPGDPPADGVEGAPPWAGPFDPGAGDVCRDAAGLLVAPPSLAFDGEAPTVGVAAAAPVRSAPPVSGAEADPVAVTGDGSAR